MDDSDKWKTTQTNGTKSWRQEQRGYDKVTGMIARTLNELKRIAKNREKYRWTKPRHPLGNEGKLILFTVSKYSYSATQIKFNEKLKSIVGSHKTTL